MPDLGAVTGQAMGVLAASRFETDLDFLALARMIWPGSFAEMLAWKPAWFVHVNPKITYPRFSRTVNLSLPGMYVGPFESAVSTGRYVDAIVDAFDLCRDYRCLVRSPHAARCVYGDMGRCPCPCDGSVSMDEYRRCVDEAIRFVAGSRGKLTERLQLEMKQASERMEFENAAASKARLDKLALFEGPAWRFVRPIDRFQFVLVQRSTSRRRLRVFLADRGEVLGGIELDFPLERTQIEAVLAQMRELSARPAWAEIDVWNVGLISDYLYAAPLRAGLVWPWDAKLTADDLIRSIQGMEKELTAARTAADSPADSAADKPPHDKL